MNTIKKVLFILTIFIMLPLGVYADCQSDFDAIKSEFKITYKYNTDTDDFTIVMTNPNNERYRIAILDFEDIENTEEKKDGNVSTTTIYNHSGSDDKYCYVVQANYYGCDGNFFLIKEMELKKYNPYADSPQCEGNENFVLCQKENDKIIEEETFESRLEIYEKTEGKSGKETKSNIKGNESKASNVKKSFLEYIYDNIIVVIAAIILAIALIVVSILLIKRAKKSRRLE